MNSAKCTPLAICSSALSGATIPGSGHHQNTRSGIFAAELITHPESGIAIISAYSNACEACAANASGLGVFSGSAGDGLIARHARRSATNNNTKTPVDLCQMKSWILVGDKRYVTAIQPSANCVKMRTATV